MLTGPRGVHGRRGGRSTRPRARWCVVAPDERRVATAPEPGTVVLAVSGTEGAAGPISPFEYWYAA